MEDVRVMPLDEEMAEAMPETEEFPGREGKIDSKWCETSNAILQDYKNGKKTNDQRIIANNEWYRLRHWGLVKEIKTNTKEPQPTTAWLFNSMANQHANAMDNFPQSVFLARSRDDEETARLLGPVVQTIKDDNRYQKIYSRRWWDKIKSGLGITGIFWDFKKNGGAGGISIRRINPLNLFWKPQIDDIQLSPRVYELEEVDKDAFVETYPFMKEKILSVGTNESKFRSDETNFNSANNVVVVHCWYKTKGQLHYAMYCGVEVLFASENVDKFKDGFYLDGEFPYEPDALYPVEDSVFGMGYIDLFKSCQMYIDKLEQVMLKNAITNSHPRVLANRQAGINKAQLEDPEEGYVECNTLDVRNLQPLKASELSGSSFNMLASKIEEMKETSANRDASQGGTSGGVVSAAGLLALQESGSKISRDIIKASYEVENRIDRKIINLMRQFMAEPEFFRIVGKDKQMEYYSFDNTRLLPQELEGSTPESPLYRLPIFDIQIKAQKQTAFSTMEVNDRMLTMFKLGMFRPDMADASIACVEGMSFEGKDELIATLQKNGTLLDLVNKMNEKIMMLEAIISGVNPQNPTELHTPGATNATSAKPPQVNPLGEAVKVNNSQALKAAERAQSQAAVI